MNIIVLGPQASGKGTQADLLEQKFGFTRIETGKILRKIAASDHPLANEIKNTMNNGKLVSDKILTQVIDEYMHQPHPNGFLFDGTPRNMEQYILIKKLLEEKNEKIDRVILVDISEEETIRRISSRRICKTCGKVYNLITNPPSGENCECGGELGQREDDFPEAIKKRLDVYARETLIVANMVEKEGLLLKINGEQSIEKIHQEIVARLGL